MKTKSGLSADEVKHIAKLANIPIPEEKLGDFAAHLSEVLGLVHKLKALKTIGVAETSQVTGLENVFREDVVEPSLAQAEVLKNAPKTHNGFFVVKAIFEE